MADTSMPRRESQLVDWMMSNSTVLTGTPARYGATPAQALTYQTAVNFYVGLYQQCVDPLTRTKAKVAAKDAARREAIVAARQMMKLVEAFPEITDELLIELGIQPRKTPTPIPAPSVSPDIDILSVSGNVVTLRIHDAATEGRRRPAGVKGAAVYSYVGTTPPGADGGWTFVGNAQKSTYAVAFPNNIEPGSMVWVTAAWFNPRGEFGPAAAPRSTYTQFGGAIVQPNAMKVAA